MARPVSATASDILGHDPEGQATLATMGHRESAA